jgi:hypothetical protein
MPLEMKSEEKQKRSRTKRLKHIIRLRRRRILSWIGTISK